MTTTGATSPASLMQLHVPEWRRFSGVDSRGFCREGADFDHTHKFVNHAILSTRAHCKPLGQQFVGQDKARFRQNFRLLR